MPRHEQRAGTRRRLILFATFMLAVPLLPDIARGAGDAIRGGRLYDDIFAAKGIRERFDTHPLYPAAGIQSGADTFRCQECHGWDYKGAAGVYGQGPHFTGIRGVFGSTKTAAEMTALLIAAAGHNYKAYGLGNGDIDDLVAFLQTRVINTSLYIDAAKRFQGSAAQGQAHYSTKCTTCHGADGTLLNTSTPEDPEYLGTTAERDPWALMHKIRFGQPGERDMPSWITLGGTDQGAADIGRYIQDGPFPTGQPEDPCQGGPAACDDGNPCTADTCDPVEGCQHADVPNGTSCSDGNPCNGAETCQNDACTPGAAPTCDDGNPCTTDGCNPAGGCSNVARPNGSLCVDATVCNGTETCQAGMCTGGTPLDCADTNPCTTDSCNAINGCQHPAVANGTSCADATVCNGAETCQAGVCNAGMALECDDGNNCTVDSCNAVVGCIHTRTDTCQCGAASECNDANPCTSDTCNAGVCQNLALADGVACADATVCNGAETCVGGNCAAGAPLTCHDGNGCTTDGCDPVAGCQYVAVTNGTSCADTGVCNGEETCQDGVCLGGGGLGCDDGNRCTLDSCNAISGCLHRTVPEGTSCADADQCNGEETCQAGICAGGTALACDDRNACTVDVCDPVNGCQHLTAEAMPSAALGCNDGDACTIDGCDPASGCTHTKVAGAAGFLCRLEQGLGACSSESLPRGPRRLIERANAQIRHAIAAKSTKGSTKALINASKMLRKASRLVARAAKADKLSGPCAAALGAVINQVRADIGGAVSPRNEVPGPLASEATGAIH